jgi:hypothetical protein
MNLRQRVEHALQALGNMPGASVDIWQPAPPLDADECAAIAALGVAVPPRLAALMQPMNGCELAWHIAGDTIAGSMNLPPLRSMLLGWSVPPGKAPFEGVLWTADQSPAALARLKRLRLVESIAGDSRCLAFDPADPDRLLLVDDETIRPLTPRCDAALRALGAVLGADGAREALCAADWSARLAALPIMALVTR